VGIWDFRAYRPYLMEKLGRSGSRTGLRKKLAEAIPVHSTFVSQVLQGRADFSLEQAEVINTFFEHTDDESEYFILLLLKDRAGTPKLRARFEKKLQSLRDERLNIRKRLDVDTAISAKDRAKFYSSYYYSAIYVLSAIPAYQTIGSLAEATKLSLNQVKEIVEFMIGIGLLQEQKGRVIRGPTHVHLGNDSELILKHHSNWRFHTINHLQFLDQDDVHYSSCISLSQDDAFRVKESLLRNLKSNVEIISKSPEEVAYVMSFDFYKLFG
jgi:uncharacterized protein (TIGR02147 family)